MGKPTGAHPMEARQLKKKLQSQSLGLFPKFLKK
jgi:hypothetical protein